MGRATTHTWNYDRSDDEIENLFKGNTVCLFLAVMILACVRNKWGHITCVKKWEHITCTKCIYPEKCTFNPQDRSHPSQRQVKQKTRSNKDKHKTTLVVKEIDQDQDQDQNSDKNSREGKGKLEFKIWSVWRLRDGNGSRNFFPNLNFSENEQAARARIPSC